jgi:drug/metabolite transporter (DMT)-like permease
VTETKQNTNLILLSFLSIVLMSIVPVLIKAVNANEITIAIVRLAIGALGIVVLAKSKQQQLLRREHLPWLLLLGVVFSLHWFTYFKSLKMSTVSLGAIGVSTFGVHLLFLNRIFFKEKLKLVDFAAVLLALGGVVLVTPDSGISPEHFNGFALAMLSGFFYACLPIINRKANHLTTEQKAFGQFGFGLLLFAWFIPMGNWQLTSFDWFGLITLGVVCTLIAHTLWIKVSSELPNSLTATVYYFYVPIAMAFSYFLFDEVLTWQKVTGAALVICANVMVVLVHNKSGRNKESTSE